MEAEFFCELTKAAIACPELGAGREKDGCEQVRVYETDAVRVERAGLDEVSDFSGACNVCLWQVIQQMQGLCAVAQRTEREFTGNEGMESDLAGEKKAAQVRILCAEVIDPD